MKHNIKFDHDDEGSLSGAMGFPDSFLDQLNNKIIEAGKKATHHPRIPFCKSLLAEALMELLDVNDLAYLATDGVYNRIKQVQDTENITKNQVVLKDDREDK